MSEELLSGVEEDIEVPAAEELEDVDLFDTDEEEAEEIDEDVEEDVPEEEPKLNDKAEKAFAKKLAAEKEKMEAKIRQELEEKYKQQPKPNEPKPTLQPQNGVTPLTDEQTEELAYKYGITPEAFTVLYNQQAAIMQLNEKINKQDQFQEQLTDQSTKAETQIAIEQDRKEKPWLPAFDEAKVTAVRNDFKAKYGVNLPWSEAYDRYVAEQAKSGSFARQAQQQAISQIKGRDRSTVHAGKGGQAQRPSIDDMSKAQFEEIIAQAKAGKFKKS